MDNKKKILALSHSPFVGGAELALKSLVDSTLNDFEWTIVVPNIAKIDESVKSDEVTYISLPDIPWWCYEAHDSPPIVNRKSLQKSISKITALANKSDVLLTNTITIPWLGFIAQQMNKPHIWYVHEFGNIDHNLKFIAGYEESLKMISNCSSRVLTISNDVKNHLGKIISADKIDLIHQSIDLNSLVGIEPVKDFSNLSVLCMGAIKPSKGQLIALKAIGGQENMSLDIIGPTADNSYAQILENEAKKFTNVSVQLRRYSPKDELSSHNLLLMCSNQEGLGRVTLEGMASARVVIGYNCVSTGELLDNDRGILYSPNTSESLLQAICNNRENLGNIDVQSARNFVLNTFNNKSQRGDFLSAVEKAMTSSSPNGSSLKDYLDIIDKNFGWKSTAGSVLDKIKKITPIHIKKVIKKLLP